MGAVYARKAGLPEAVAVAISEQYLPAGAGAAPPASVPGALVALADKLDSLATAFGLGEQPTGSRDPYGLRRAAAGVVAIVLDRGWSVDLASLVGARSRAASCAGVGRVRVGRARSSTRSSPSCSTAPMPRSRPRACRPRRSARRAGRVVADPLAHVELARALHAAGPELSAARAGARAVPADREQVRRGCGAALDAALLRDAAEVELAQTLDAVAPRIAAAAGRRDFAGGLAAAAELAPAIDRFFADVMVMDEDLAVRANRLRLMIDVVEATRPIGDLSALPG